MVSIICVVLCRRDIPQAACPPKSKASKAKSTKKKDDVNGKSIAKTTSPEKTAVEPSRKDDASPPSSPVKEAEVPKELRISTDVANKSSKELMKDKPPLVGNGELPVEHTADSDSFDSFRVPPQFRMPKKPGSSAPSKHHLPAVFDVERELNPPTAGPPIREDFMVSFPVLYGVWKMTESELRAYLFLRPQHDLTAMALESVEAAGHLQPRFRDERIDGFIGPQRDTRAAAKHSTFIHSIVLDVEAWRMNKDSKYKRGLCPWAYPNMTILSLVPTYYLKDLYNAEPLNSDQLKMILCAIQQLRDYRRQVEKMKMDDVLRVALKSTLKERIDKLKMVSQWACVDMQKRKLAPTKHKKNGKTAAATPASASKIGKK